MEGMHWALLLAMLEVSRPSGIEFRHVHSPSARKHLPEAMGGGVALLDYNNDGLLDVFLVNSGQLGVPRTEPRFWNRLYQQNRDGSFTDVTRQAGLAGSPAAGYGMGVATADYDGDGFTDLYVTNFGANVLYRNTGKGGFVDATTKAGVAAGGWSASAGFFDFDNDGRPDLFVTRYMDWTLATSQACGSAPKVYCPPATFPAVANVLYRNLGDGVFQDVSTRSGIAAAKGRALGVAFADADDDGHTDIFVANDGMEQFFFHNRGDGTFTERAIEAGAALSGDGQPVSGMGVDFRDYDNDGRPDVVVTTLSRQRYALFRNEGGGVFGYHSLLSNLGALSSIHSGWGVAFADFDNDGWKDLLAAQGHVMDNVQQLDPSLRSQEPPLLLFNRKGRFEESSLGPVVPGRGLAIGDIDNDGALDAVMSVLGGAPVVYRNRPGPNNWLQLKLKSLGARVTVNGQRQEAGTAGSYLSAHDGRLHFGLGTATAAEIEVRWPSGRTSSMRTDQLNRVLTIEEP